MAPKEAASSLLGDEWSEALSKVPTSTNITAERLRKIVGDALKERWRTYVFQVDICTNSLQRCKATRQRSFNG